jgi:hypothetical protein
MPGLAVLTRCVSFAALLAVAGTAGASELRDAVDRVRQETGGYILSAQTLQTHRGTVHRVKVLTRDGRVEVRQIAAGFRGDPLGLTPEPRADDGGSLESDEGRQERRWLGTVPRSTSQREPRVAERDLEFGDDRQQAAGFRERADLFREEPSRVDSAPAAIESGRFDAPVEPERAAEEPPERR